MQDQNQERGVRFEKMLDHFNSNQNAFSKAVNLSQSYINGIVHGKKNISSTVIAGITKLYPMVNIEWLLHGKGDMIIGSANVTQGRDVSKVEGPLEGLIDLLDKHERRIAELEGKMDYLLEKRPGDESKG